MYAFNGYCYPDAAAVAVAAGSDVGQSFGDWVLTAAGVSGSTLTLDYVDAADVAHQVQATLAACDQLGPLASNVGTGISVADASALAFAVVSVWIVGFSVAQIRRTLDALGN